MEHCKHSIWNFNFKYLTIEEVCCKSSSLLVSEISFSLYNLEEKNDISAFVTVLMKVGYN